MKVFITGMAGFIGYHLAKRLMNDNYEIIGIDNINDYYSTQLKYDRLNKIGIDTENISYGKFERSYLNSKIKFIKLDLGDKQNLLNLFSQEKFDFVVNLAAQAGVRYSLINPESYINSNIVGFLNILECCRQYPVKHLIYASSSSVYGTNTKIPFSENDITDNPASLYAATKKSNELMAHTYSHLFNIPTTGLRFFTVYGEWGRPDMATYIFSENIIAEKPINLFNNGFMKRDFTYIDDVVDAIVRLIQIFPEVTPPFNVFNIGNNTPVELINFVKILERYLGKEAIIDFKPIQPGDVVMTYADVNKLENTISFKPYTTLEKGLENFCDWFLKYKEKSVK